MTTRLPRWKMGTVPFRTAKGDAERSERRGMPGVDAGPGFPRSAGSLVKCPKDKGGAAAQPDPGYAKPGVIPPLTPEKSPAAPRYSPRGTGTTADFEKISENSTHEPKHVYH